MWLIRLALLTLIVSCKLSKVETRLNSNVGDKAQEVQQPSADQDASAKAASQSNTDIREIDKVSNPVPTSKMIGDADVRIKTGDRATPNNKKRPELSLNDGYDQPFLKVTVSGGSELFHNDYLIFTQPVDISGNYSYATIRVSNLGMGPLELGSIKGEEGVEIESDFTSLTVQSGSTTTAKIRVRRNAGDNVGWNEGSVFFSHNDLTVFSPFRFFVEWQVPSEPFMKVKISNIDVESGGKVRVSDPTPLNNTPVTRTISIHNEGTANLRLGPGSITLTNDIEMIEEPASSTILPGRNTTFKVGYRYNEKPPGDYVGLVRIPSNDTDRNPFEFSMEFWVPSRNWKFRDDMPERFFTKRPTFAWHSSREATTYDINISERSDCSPPFLQSYLDRQGNLLQVTTDLEDGVYFLCGVAKIDGLVPHPSPGRQVEVEMDRVFRDLPDNQDTTWFPADKMTYLLHFNEDYIGGAPFTVKNSAVSNQDATYWGTSHNKALNAKLANGISLYYDHLTLNDSGGLSPETPNFSMSFWMYQKANVGYQTIYEDYGSKVLNWIEMSSIGGFLEFRLRDDTGKFRHLRHNTKLNLNQWYHIAVTSDAQVTTLYVNGVPVQTNKINTMGPIRMAGGKEPSIGASADNENIENFIGLMDEFAFWKDQRLTDAQIQRMYFFQNSHIDAKVPVLTAFTQGVKTFSNNPENHGYDAGRELDKDYTVTFSVKPKSIQSVTTHPGNYMFGKFYGGRHYTIACIYFNQTHALHGGFYCNQLKLGANGDRRTIGSLQHKINDGSFHHIAISKRGATLRLYLNGLLINTLQNALGNVGGNGPLVSGGRFVQDHLDGDMKNLRVFVKALTDQEIGSIATADR